MTEPSQPTSFVETVARKRESVSYGLLALGVVMLALTIFWAIRWNSGRDQPAPSPTPPADIAQPEGLQPPESPRTERSDYLPAAIWGALLAVLLIAAGCIFISRKPAPGREIYETRLLLLSVGGAAGLLTAMLGFVFAWRWQDELVRWVNLGAIGGAKWVVGALAIFLAGLVLMFFSLQLARAEERKDVILRRVLYGSNAVLTGLLMLLLLAVVNIIVFLKLPDNMISTSSAFKGLSDPSKDLLNGVTDEVKVYVIMPENASIQITRTKSFNGVYADCRALLSACQAQNRRIKVVPLSPVTDGDEIRRTMKRLKVPEEQIGHYGLLLGFGKSEDLSAFIPTNELYEGTPQGAVVFQGENRLMTELNFLSGGGQRPIVYFTQSNDEPAIGDDGGKKISIRSMRALTEHLRERKYEVRPLVFERGKKPDLAEAAMIVVVAPRIPFEQEQLDILAEYLKSKPGGKLVALLPAFQEVGSTAVSRTGLELLLADYGVTVDEKLRVFSLPNRGIRSPLWVHGTNSAESRQAKHRLSRFFAEEASIPFGNLRPISSSKPSPVFGNLMTLNLFETLPGWITYRDTQFTSDPDKIREQLRQEVEMGVDRTAREKLVTQRPIPFGVYVAERVEDRSGLRERPRLLVIGTDWFATDDVAASQGQVYIAMMGAMLEYMRERPNIGIEPRALGTYNLPKDPDGISLLVLPIGLVVLGILGLGVGVWVTRRR